MKRKLVAAMIFTGTLCLGAHACISTMSKFSAGIVFSAGEQLYTENIGKFCGDTDAYIKECAAVQSDAVPVKIGSTDGLPADQLTVDSAGITGNILTVKVQYGGGCQEHAIGLVTDGSVKMSLPAQVLLYVSHDAKGDNCMALVYRTLKFDLSPLGPVDQIVVSIAAPGASIVTKLPLWSSVQEPQECFYKLRNVYCPLAMTYIGAYKGLYNDDRKGLHQLLVVFDTIAVPTQVQKAEAILAELQRLSEMGVLGISKTQIGIIGDQLKAHQGQYWTKEDSVLDFNQWFDGKVVNGVWSVNGVKGCGTDIAYQLPKNRIPTIAVRSKAPVAAAERLQVVYHSGTLTITGCAAQMNRVTMEITDLRGCLIASVPMITTTQNAVVGRQQIASGCYLFSLHDQYGTAYRGMISITQ